MKRELREELAREFERRDQGGITRFVENNHSILKAFGIASAIVLTGFSAVHLVKLFLNKKGLGNQENFLI